MTEQPIEYTPVNRLDDLAADEKITPVMVYTPTSLSWGQMITRENLRPSLIFHTVPIPEYLSIFKVNSLNLQSNELSKPSEFQEMHFPIKQVIGFHLMPPHEEPLDYDQDEPNRRMEDVTILVGTFFFRGKARLSTQASLKRFLDVSKSDFFSIYSVKISHMSNPKMKPILTPSAVIRREEVLFAGV
ncbi:MAG: hypothetical protein FVQ83_15765 [Chloroflexi bacterium]|nr:hypothetical protein [Chloroflexota bacterium]